jgi:hypothetical protein
MTDGPTTSDRRILRDAGQAASRVSEELLRLRQDLIANSEAKKTTPLHSSAVADGDRLLEVAAAVAKRVADGAGAGDMPIQPERPAQPSDAAAP